MALPPGAFGSAVTGREISTKDEACKGRLSGVFKGNSDDARASATLAPAGSEASAAYFAGESDAS
jgi:hypothetical protein